MTFSRNQFSACAAAVAAFGLFAFVSAPAAQALTASGHAVSATAATSGLVLIHGGDDEDGDQVWRHRRHQHHHDAEDGDEVVEAPFTRVEHGRRVVVDAPFAHVYVDRYGRHIVAPFVNLHLPR